MAALSAHSIDLVMLESTVRIRCPDRKWLEIIRKLWGPFETAMPTTNRTLFELQEGDRRFVIHGDDGFELPYADPWSLLANLRELLTREALAHREQTINLHAASFVKGAVGLSLVGPPYAGKTTLGIALLEQGWSYISDDLTPIETTSHLLLPFPKPISIRDVELWVRLSSRWDPPPWLGEPPLSTGLIPASAFGHTKTPVRPTHLLFPRYERSSRAEFDELTMGMAVALCARNLHPSGDTAAALPGLGEFCRPLARARMSYGSTEAALELLNGFVGD